MTVSEEQVYHTVTIAIPTYNEASHIESIVTGFLNTAYPHLLEILVVDGGSNDGTQAIVERLAQTDARVRLLHNLHKIQSGALNIAIHEMWGDIFIRADAHADYAPDYVERCVETLLETQALNVGGMQRFVAANPFQAGVALATKSILGSGGARHRNPEYSGYSDTLHLACFWKKTVEKLDCSLLRPTVLRDDGTEQQCVPSIFDLEQITNQDSELNQRFLQMNPQAVYVSARIKSWYYPRNTWLALARQYFRFGRGRSRTAMLHPSTSPRRIKTPLIVATTAVILWLGDVILLKGRLHVSELILLGCLLPVLEGLRVTWQHRHTFETDIWRGEKTHLPSLVQCWFFCSLALYTMAPAFLLGYIYQMVRRKLFGITGW
jgi:glycosyltransferase involved in cell wall biosynthesis